MRKITIYMLLSLFCMMSCSKEHIEDSIPPPHNELFIRFVSPVGTNILDSLGVGGELYTQAERNDIQVECINAWDNEVMSLHPLAWCTIPPGYYWKGKTKEDNTEMPCMTEGTVIYISWTDFNLIGNEKRPANYTATYVVTIKSPEIFGNDEIHTVKWDVKVNGNTFDANNVCEIDGNEYSLVGDALYDYWSIYFGDELPSNRHHDIAAQMTMTIKR